MHFIPSPYKDDEAPCALGRKKLTVMRLFRNVVYADVIDKEFVA